MHSVARLVGALVLVLSFVCAASRSNAQERYEDVQYYVYPYGHAVQIDPLGILLGRIGARMEFRFDPLISRYIEVAYQPNLNTEGQNDIRTPSISAGVGERIYLRDNCAIVGLFAGANLALALIDNVNPNVRLTIEIGAKLPIGNRFFLEPELLIDSYLFVRQNMRQIFPYVALPMGVMF